MPGTVTVTNAQGQPNIAGNVDLAMCFVGPTSKTPLAAGQVSAPYFNPATILNDYGISDMVDCAAQAVNRTAGNPSPMSVSLYQTPPTNVSTYGTINTTGVHSGGSVVTAATISSTIAAGSNNVVLPAPTGIISLASTTGLPTTGGSIWIGTLNTWVQFTGVSGSTITGCTGGVGTLLTGQVTSLAPLGTYQPWMQIVNGGTVGVAGMTAYASLDGGRTRTLVSLGTLTGYWYPPADGFAGQANFAFAAGTFNAGDTFYTNTLPAVWADADLYTAGTPATGAFGAIATSSQSFGVIVITEPVGASDIATLVSGLNYLVGFNKRPTILCRFRDQQYTGETTAQYIAALKGVMATTQDNRITVVGGAGWLTDALTNRVYQRSGLPSVCARLQGAPAFPGTQGEVLAQSPAWAGRGPLENFTIVDGSGNPVAGSVDGFIQGGLDGPIGSFGGLLNFCYQRDPNTIGTYVSSAPVIYGVNSSVLTLMDSRVVQAISRVLYSIAWTQIQSAAIVSSGILDPDICDAIGALMRNAIGENSVYKHEFANAADPNLVVVSPNVTVSGPNVTISVSVNDKLFDYINNIPITLFNVRQ